MYEYFWLHCHLVLDFIESIVKTLHCWLFRAHNTKLCYEIFQEQERQNEKKEQLTKQN